MTALLTAAQRYADRGWAVFPCERRGKRPLVTHGVHDATLDAATIERWWARVWPDANIGVRTGMHSGIVVVDVDGDEGADSLADLERQHGLLPRTASVQTPSGGAHYYLKHPGGQEVRNSVRQLGPGLDIRGDGGYVIAPPSVGANGRQWEPDERASLAELPGWLQDRLVPDREKVAQRAPASEWVMIARNGLGEGERNHGIARLTGHLLARDVDARLVLELAYLVNARFRPPLPAGEVDRVVESIAGRELRKRGGRR